MVENQSHKPNKSRLAEIPGWELRSPGHATTPAASRFDHTPRSDSYKPQHVNIEAPPVATPTIPVGPAQAFKLSAQRFLPNLNLSTKAKWMMAGGSAALAASLLAVFVRTVTPPPEEPQQPHATGPVAEEPVIMGTGPGRRPEPQTARILKESFPPAEALASRRIIEPRLQGIILSAAEQEGLHPNLMVRLFGKESGFDSRATSDTGAAGLCQFTEQTFMGTLAKHGERLGLDEYSDQIKRSKNGYYADRQHFILNLRYKPAIAVPVCAAYIKDELQYMKAYVGRPLTFTDSSLAHFTGAGVAKDLIRAYDDPKGRKDPAYIYAERVNYQGVTNRSIFFEGGNFKKPYTVEELYHSKMRVMGTTPALIGGPTGLHASARNTPSPK